jgi:radical SAM superfamily enzyme YgiQ (UPF0313 family)
MRIHLVNPSDVSFGVSVITPRWLYVLAAATPTGYGPPNVVDETLEPFGRESVERGDVVGIGIHTLNAYRGYQIGQMARERGAYVVFGGVHASLYPREAREHGSAHAIVRGDGEVVWEHVIADCVAGQPCEVYEGGRIPGASLRRARWELLPKRGYMWATVQTVRGCPKHCSFCSVWRTDGQQPRLRGVEDVVDEIRELRARGFRFIVLADDNFYPVAFADLAKARRRLDPTSLRDLEAVSAERFELMRRLADLPDDITFFTQITMEAAEDPAFLDAMRAAHIRGALVGVESVTSEGLKSIHKDFNLAGDALAERLRTFRRHGVHVLGSFIFGLPTDTRETFDATVALAERAEIAFPQFIMLQPLPGTLDFERWEKTLDPVPEIGGVPLTRYWLLPSPRRPKVYIRHPQLGAEDIRRYTQSTWDQLYTARAIWRRSRFLKSLSSRLLFLMISKVYRQMYVYTGIATDSARHAKAARMARWLARPCRRLFVSPPRPAPIAIETVPSS